MPVRDPIHFLAMHFRVELPELLRRYRGSPNTALHTAVLSPSEILSGGAVAASSEVDRSVGTHVYETVKLTTRPAMDLRRGGAGVGRIDAERYDGAQVAPSGRTYYFLLHPSLPPSEVMVVRGVVQR